MKVNLRNKFLIPTVLLVIMGTGVSTSASSISPVSRMNFVTLMITLVVTVILALGMWLLTGHLILKPISKVREGLKDIAESEGDLTRRLTVNDEDEVGELSKWFNTFMEKLQRIILDIGENADSLNASSVELSKLSGNMSRGAEGMTTNSNTVANAAGQMSSNISSVAAAMEEASTNMNLVASAAEEMTATINEIAQNSEKARSITGEAVSQASGGIREVSEKMTHSSTVATEIAKDIGEVNRSSGEMSNSSSQMEMSANELSQLAAGLNGLVGKFKVN